jgi:hypothetical protein
VRQVNGFLGGEWNEYQGYVAVRAGDAHSWDEVFFPSGPGADGGRWVTFDPTPSGDDDDLLGRGGSGWRARLGRFIDTLRFQWSKWVIEYDLVSQLQLFKSVGEALKNAVLAVKDVIVAVKDWLVARWWLAIPVVGAIAFVVLRRRRRRRGSRDLVEVPRRPRIRSTVAETYDQVARVLARAGFAREVAVTPKELAARMIARGDPGAAQLGELVELYYTAEWGGRRDPTAEARAAQLAAEIRAALEAARRDKRARRSS